MMKQPISKEIKKVLKDSVKSPMGRMWSGHDFFAIQDCIETLERELRIALNREEIGRI